ncbi:MAG TPA: ribosome biogenesis GTP-binding protein YihA/YsxC [Myxococcota bacterium]|jgi:GTP-binding protein
MKVLAAELLATAARVEDFPRTPLAEIALLGRSNVGKSSLLNRLAQRRKLARTSTSPGKTRLVHFYRIDRPGRSLLLVDLPGYGWARVSKAERAGWKSLVEAYLGARERLRGAVLLQDLRRDWGEDEALLGAWLAERGVPVLLVLTKADKLGAAERARRVRSLTAHARVAADRCIVTSSLSGEGIEALWRAIDAIA